METVAYLTQYDALLCADCATDTSRLGGDGKRWVIGLTPLERDHFRECCEDVYGYDSARCEECHTVLFDGLAIASL